MIGQREAIVHCIVINELIYRRRAAIGHIHECLDILGVLDLIRNHADTVRQLFLYENSYLTVAKYEESMTMSQSVDMSRIFVDCRRY